MDSSSPSKRRKTSPTTSVAVDAPSLIPGRNGEATTPSRASFLSPTKASLARFNPGLLPRPRSAGIGAQRPGSQGNGVSGQDPTPRRPRSAHGGGSWINGSGGPSKPAIPARDKDGEAEALTKPPMGKAGTASPGRTTRPLRGGLSAAPRRRSRTPGQASSPEKVTKPTKELLIAASPPEAANETQDVAQKTIDGQLEQELQGSAERRSARLPQAHEGADQGEPELPPTPTQLGLEAPPEPPKGLLNSPSRRPKRKKSSGVQSSPLKPRDPPPEITSKKPRRSSTRIKGMMKQPDKETEAKVEEPSGEVLQKQRTRDELRRQLQKLQADVALCEQEIERDHESDNLPAPDEDTVSRLMYVNHSVGSRVYPLTTTAAGLSLQKKTQNLRNLLHRNHHLYLNSSPPSFRSLNTHPHGFQRHLILYHQTHLFRPTDPSILKTPYPTSKSSRPWNSRPLAPYSQPQTARTIYSRNMTSP